MNNLFKSFIPKSLLSFLLLLSISLPVGAAESFNLLDSLGGADDGILDVDDAFQVSHDSQPGQFAVNWIIADGHYLYRDKMQITTDDPGVIIKPLQMPAGEAKEDPIFNKTLHVFHHFADATLPYHYSNDGDKDVTFKVKYQGCSEISGICYPPQTRKFTVRLSPISEAQAATIASSSAETAPTVVSEQDEMTNALRSGSLFFTLAIFFGAGLLLAFTPCVFPMVPILSGIIAGQGDSLTTMKAFWLSLVYVLAMAVTYTVAGVLAGLFGQNLQAAFQNPWIISGFVLIFIALAFSMFGFFELQLPGRLQTRLTEASNRQQGGQLWGVAVMGFLSALIVGPCVAPPLMAALIVIGETGDAMLGGTALFALSMGMGAPLILFGVSAGKLVPRAGAWMDAVKAVFGVGMLAVAIWMLERILEGGLIMLLWGMLAIACGIYLGALERIEAGVSGWKRLWKSLGIVLLVLGAVEIVGAAAGGDYWLKPLERFAASTAGTATGEQVEFRRIKSLQDLEQELVQAGSSGKGAMLDFYADWCVECIRMEKNTFRDAGVQAQFGHLQLLQADVTANDDLDQGLMKEYGIIGPPAILFFNRQGEEMRAYRLVGYFTPEKFVSHLQKVVAAQ